MARKKDKSKPSFFRSTDPTVQKIDTYTPQQQELLKKISGLIPQGLANINLPGQQSNFAPIEANTRRQFAENTVPTLAERFASLGSGGSLNSSAFANSLSSAGSGLEQELASMRQQYGLQEQGMQNQNLFNLLQQGLSPQFAAGIVPGQDSAIRNLWNKASGPATQAAANYFTGGVSGALSGLGGQQQQPQQQMQMSQPQQNFAFQTPQANQPFQYNPSQLSTQNLATAGYPGLNTVGAGLAGLSGNTQFKNTMF